MPAPSSVETRNCPLCKVPSNDSRCGSCGAAIEAGDYRIERLISQTAHSRVYAAVDREGRQVALKELAFALAPDAQSIDAFAREAALLQQVNHPRVPKFFRAFQEGTGPGLRLYVAQELIEGVSLLSSLEQGIHFSEAVVLEIAESVLTTLHALHSRKPPIIHRDIKPANLIRRANGAIVLVDFGAARATATGTMHHSTVVGTFGYMPPEQFGGRIDATSDLYALGATLVHLISGESPERFLVGYQLVIKGKLGVSPRLEKFLERLLQTDHSKRFPSSDDALLALRALTKSKSTRASPQLSSMLVWGVPIGLIALGGAIVLARSQPSQPPVVPTNASYARSTARVEGKLPAKAELGGHEPHSTDGGTGAAHWPHRWRSPVPLTELNARNTNDGEMTLSVDLSRTCFHSDRAGGKGEGDIWCGQRARGATTFEAPRDQTSLNSSAFDSDPALNADGSEIFFWSGRPGGPGNGDLYHAYWNAEAGDFGAPTLLSELSTSGREWGPAVTPDNLTLYFTSDRPGGHGDVDIYRATRPSLTSSFGSVENVSVLNSAGGELEPNLTIDGSVLIFCRYLGGLWISDRGADGQWATPVPIVIDEIGGLTGLCAPRIGSDGRLYFQAQGDLYVAESVSP